MSALTNHYYPLMNNGQLFRQHPAKQFHQLIAILEWLKHSVLIVFLKVRTDDYGKNLISKESLAEYLANDEGQRIARPSQTHREMLAAFIGREQKSGMEFGSMSP